MARKLWILALVQFAVIAFAGMYIHYLGGEHASERFDRGRQVGRHDVIVALDGEDVEIPDEVRPDHNKARVVGPSLRRSLMTTFLLAPAVILSVVVALSLLREASRIHRLDRVAEKQAFGDPTQPNKSWDATGDKPTS